VEDDADDGITPCLTCHVELDVSGPNSETVNKWVADALRRLAHQIERDELETGHHDVPDNVGKKIGEVYLDHYGHSEEI
jgi:methylphosphotriester-DNA--protein-cysteine methyltransferase